MNLTPREKDKLLIAMAAAALAYCLGAPFLANLVAHFAS